MTVAGTSIRPETAVTTVIEDSQLVARVKNFDVLQNGYIVFSASDVNVGQSLNPDAEGNQKFAIIDTNVSGTIDATVNSTLRAYLVYNEIVVQRCGRLTISDEVFSDLTLNGAPWVANEENVPLGDITIAGVLNKSGVENVALMFSNNKPTVGTTTTSLRSDTTVVRGRPFSMTLNVSVGGRKWWLVGYNFDQEDNKVIEVVYDYYFAT